MIIIVLSRILASKIFSFHLEWPAGRDRRTSGQHFSARNSLGRRMHIGHYRNDVPFLRASRMRNLFSPRESILLASSVGVSPSFSRVGHEKGNGGPRAAFIKRP